MIKFGCVYIIILVTKCNQLRMVWFQLVATLRRSNQLSLKTLYIYNSKGEEPKLVHLTENQNFGA